MGVYYIMFEFGGARGRVGLLVAVSHNNAMFIIYGNNTTNFMKFLCFNGHLDKWHQHRLLVDKTLVLIGSHYLPSDRWFYQR